VSKDPFSELILMIPVIASLVSLKSRVQVPALLKCIFVVSGIT
jgi:hypothetical protein